MAWMTRRGMIGATLAAAPGALLAVPITSTPNARPSFHMEPASPGRWRFRSWTWQSGSWQPSIGHVTVEGGELRISGRPDPQDRPAFQAALATIAKGRSGNSAR